MGMPLLWVLASGPARFVGLGFFLGLVSGPVSLIFQTLLVVNEFLDCVEVFFVLLVGIGLDWFCVVFVKKENVEFSKEMLSKFYKKKPLFLF